MIFYSSLILTTKLTQWQEYLEDCEKKREREKGMSLRICEWKVFYARNRKICFLRQSKRVGENRHVSEIYKIYLYFFAFPLTVLETEKDHKRKIIIIIAVSSEILQTFFLKQRNEKFGHLCLKQQIQCNNWLTRERGEMRWWRWYKKIQNVILWNK